MPNEDEKRVVIVIPVYRSPVAYESISLTQCVKVLGRYPIVLVTPESMDIHPFLSMGAFGVERFADYYFESTNHYSELLLSEAFYRRFQSYEYLFIYQPDAFVFSDRLMEFCRMGDDYIGAPVPRWAWRKRKQRVGNGGCSLRKVSSCLRILSEFPPRDHSAESAKEMRWTLPEDLYFAECAGNPKLDFHSPTLRQAMEFCVDFEVFGCYQKLPRWLPFACHAWQKKLDVWQDIIESFGYVVGTEGTSKKDDAFQRNVLREYVIERLCRTHSKNLLAQKFVRQVVANYGLIAFWGYGKEGRRWEMIFRTVGLPIPLIFDRNAEGGDARVVSPSREAVMSCNRMILITSTRYAEAIAEELRGYGLKNNRDFMGVGHLLDEIGVRYCRAIFASLRDA